MLKLLFFIGLFTLGIHAVNADQRLGVIDGGRNFQIKEGSLYAGWVTETGTASNALQIGFTRSRIAYLNTAGALLAKEPGLYDGWTVLASNVSRFALTEGRIGIVHTDGSMQYKDNDALGDSFTTIYGPGTVKELAMSASRIGILKTNGSFCVIEGEPNFESCLRTDGFFCHGSSCAPPALNVKEIALAHQWDADRIGYLNTNGQFFVNEGSVTAPFILETGSNVVSSIALSNNRIAVLFPNGQFRVKEGSLSASWSILAPAGSGITSIALSGTRIGYLAGTNFYAKEGALDAPWVLETGSATAIAFSDYTLANVVGPEQVVFSHATQACPGYPGDYPDTPTRAFRDSTGNTQLLISHDAINHRMVGPSLNALTVECRNLLPSPGNANPDARNDQEWLHGGIYTLDGIKVLALVHNEYHGNNLYLHPNNPYCPVQELIAKGYDPSRTCFKASTNMAISLDGGASYSADGRGDLNLPSVAWLPYPYDNTANIGFLGLYGPTNIIFNPNDNYYYAMVQAGNEDYKEQGQGSCLLRTQDIFSPSSWRAYDGSGFNIAFYTIGTQGATCRSVLPNGTRVGTQQLVFNTYLNRFMLIAYNRGVYMFVAPDPRDLTKWGNPTQLTGLSWPSWPAVAASCTGLACPKAYASILDPNDPSRNYERPGQNVNLYYTRFNNFVSNGTTTVPDENRDLASIAIQFQQ